MELRHFRYFAALAETLHFTRAAQRLFVTQSTLSHQIHQLEETLGTPLFNRTGRAIHLTPAGLLFKSHAMQVLRQVDGALAAVDEMGALKRGALAVGSIHSFNHAVLLPVVVAFTRQYPALKLRIEETTTPDIEAGVVVGSLDLGITVAPVKAAELVMEPLFEEDYVLVVRKRHPLASAGRAKLSDLSEQPLAMLTQAFTTRRLIDLHCEVKRVVPRVVFESNSIECVMDVVSHTDLASVLPRTALARRQDLRGLEITAPAPKRTCGLCWLKNGHRSAAATALAAMLQAHVRSPHWVEAGRSLTTRQPSSRSR